MQYKSLIEAISYEAFFLIKGVLLSENRPVFCRSDGASFVRYFDLPK
jgi:hypothetical protein